MGVRNAERLPALQALFEEFGVRPTYLVTSEMATRPESAAVLARLARSGRCEIGPTCIRGARRPSVRRTSPRHTYPHNLPRTCSSGSSASSRRDRETLGVRPTTYRAGRNGFDGARCPSSSASATPSTPASIRSSTSGARAG
jgi:hypothetical protein